MRRLTQTALDGLRLMATVADAGNCNDFLGHAPDCEPGDCPEWVQIEAAMRWLDSVSDRARGAK